MKLFELYNILSKAAIKENLEDTAIKMLIKETLQYNSTDYILHSNDELDENMVSKITDICNKYIIDKISVQYILGYQYFYGNKFIVNENTLIPRFETEELVTHVIDNYKKYYNDENINLVDIGTGSGAIGISIKKECPNIDVTLTDISDKALEVAGKNATLNEVNVSLIQGDMLEPLIRLNKKFDILVSNPPYVKSEDEVDFMVKKNEPSLALYGGNDGMKFYRIILEDSNKIMNNKFIMMFEHHHECGNEMYDLAKNYYPNAVVEVIKDICGKDRFTLIINM